ncbi:MAG: DUF4369 domain-containing protein [Bacteroidales bacterium]|nr:DUF4369 domain-containing protein [Bacteroidales bacterium]
MNVKRIILIIIVLCVNLNLFPQKGGYNIKVTVSDIPAEKVYLMGYVGMETWIADSAVVAKDGSFVFRSKATLPKGFYHIVGSDEKEYLEIVVDKTSQFSIKTTMSDLRSKREIKKSLENSAFFEFQKATLMTVLTPAARESVYRSFADMSPTSLLSVFLKAMSRPSEEARSDTFFLCNRYFDQIDLNDERLLHVPMVPKKVMDYFNLLPLSPDSMVKYTDLFLQKIDNKEVERYYLAQLFKHYSDYVPNYDVVLVHLYDTYCVGGKCDFLDDSRLRIIGNRVKRARKLMPGAEVPEIVSYGADGNTISTADLKSKYLLLWVWDPDCDDCVELTPKLNKIFEENAAVYDFDVYAVALTEDFELWQNFVNENNLAWHNTSLAGGEANFDIQEYFDIMTTPFVLLLDENRRIVAKQFAIDKLLPLMR